MISVEEALARILGAFSPLPAETVGLTEALGRVLAEDVTAALTQPPHDVSAMDGYAVRAADLTEVPIDLEVVAEIAAGTRRDEALGPGQAVRIFTGAPLPPGADAIVIQENTEAGSGQVRIFKSVGPGRYVRPAGLDFRAGEAGIAAGRRLTSRDIGLAAAMNRPWLKVRRRPRVAILSTGDEVVLPGEALGESQIVASNGFSLSAFVTAVGGQAIHLGIAADERARLDAALDQAAGSDLLVTSGGASVGKHDLVQGALVDKGMDLDFWKIAMRPGKPLMFGRMGPTPVLGLPGNPVSSLVCALLFLRPAISALLGVAEDLPEETAILGRDLGENDERQDYLRARLKPDASGQLTAVPFERQDSSMLATLSRADCLVVRAPHAPPTAAGERVTILRLGGPLLGI
ncbi:MAG: molybdopterin molybdotransferase MoeA [Kiloniellales bacterium]|nr:molybdopterin molybdotransferase MoeA [Kiloniellales bacterium]